MLWSRTAETSAIDAVLGRAQAGQGGGLLLRGEPGIGKSALLRYARERAGGACVLAAAGTAAESGLAYAAVHQLLGPLLPGVDGLPGPQAAALRIALGLQAAADAPDPFLVSLAVLTLLSDAGRPVFCLVDDVQWLDGPSAGVLAFVIRRIRDEPIVVLAAARAAPDPGDHWTRTDPVDRLVQAGLPERVIGRLAPGEASALLAERSGPLAAPVRDALLAAAAGHPLALIELPGTLRPAQLAGTEPLPEPLPLAGELERVFAARVSQLDPGPRALALLCACSGRLPAVTAAAAALGVDAAGLDRLDGLIAIEAPAVVFAHPLIRSAVYYQASPAERRAAHAALADREEDDRRAWHLARAAAGPDERAAAELERAANRTLRRSGYAAAAAALERAAELSPADTDRSRRLAAAADAAWHGADASRVQALIDRAERLPPPEPAVRLRLRHIRGLIGLRSGMPADGLAILLPGAAEAVKADPHLAVAMLAAAGECAFQAGDEGAALEIAALLAALPDSGDPRDALIAGLYRSVGPVPRGEPPVPCALNLGDLRRAPRAGPAQRARPGRSGGAGRARRAAASRLPGLGRRGRLGAGRRAGRPVPGAAGRPGRRGRAVRGEPAAARRHRPADAAGQDDAAVRRAHLRRHRRRADARGYLHLAADAFERLGAARWAQRARDELRATGETVRKRGQGQAIDRLTSQELQVARAVSQGLTNREAAAQLFLSPRTVDHHLRGVYRKFGISSRAELALLAGQLAGP